YLLKWTYAGQHGYPGRSRGWCGLSTDLPGIPGVVPRRCLVRSVFGPFALARRLSMSIVRPRSGVANLDPTLEMRELRPQDLRHGGHHFSSHPDPVEYVVRRHLVGHLAEERCISQES